MERDLHRIHIEGQGSKPIADMAVTSVTASAFSRGKQVPYSLT